MLPEQLKQLRLALGFRKQTDFAAALQDNRSYLCRMENGKQPISQEFIDKLLLRFPLINPDWIETGNGEPILPPPPIDDAVKREAKIELILEALAKLEPETRELVLQAIERFNQHDAPATEK